MRITKKNSHVTSNGLGYYIRVNVHGADIGYLFTDGKIRKWDSAVKHYMSVNKARQACYYPSKEAAEQALDDYIAAHPIKTNNNKLIREKISNIKQWLDELGWSKTKKTPDSGAGNYGRWPLSDGKSVSFAEMIYDLIETAGIKDFPPCDEKEFSRRMRLND